MTINKLDLLSNSARYQLDILRIFDARNGQSLSIEILVELLGISKFKVNKYILELEQVLEETTSARVIYLSKGDIEIYHLSNEVIRKIQLYYLKQSDLFLLLHEIVQFESTPEKFSQKFFLSRSKAYMIKNKLEDILLEADIHINEGKLVGDEITIRREIFAIYYFFFNGLEAPFDITLRHNKHEVMEIIIHTLNLDTVITRLAKLELFLSIVILRMMNNNYIETVEIEFANSHSEKIQQQLEFIQKKLQKIVSIPKEKQKYEQLWLLIFLISEECISLTDYATIFKICPDLTDLTNKQVDYIFQTLKLSFPKTEQKQRRLQLFQELNLTNFKLVFASYSHLTFYTFEEESLFAELYPQFHQVAKKFVEMVRKSNIYNKQLIIKSGLYYDYIFAIISVIPQKYLFDKIYICVDFSQGSSYTSFIAETIKIFQSLNIEVQQKVNNQTQLYVSDIMIDKLNCPQIIWKNPPSDYDWLLFGEMLIKVSNKSGI